jgi:hypothetical protein
MTVTIAVINIDRVKCDFMLESREITPYKFSDSAAYSAKDCAIKACATAMGSEVNL